MSIIQVLAGIGQPVDPYFEYTTLLLPGSGTNGAQNNTFLDGSTNNFTITRNGNTTQGTFSPFSQTGWGGYASATGQYLTAAGNAAFALSNSDFTIEGWIYPTALNTYNFVYNRTSPTLTEIEFAFSSTGSISAIGYVGAGQTAYAATSSSGVIVANRWQHVAAVRSGGTLTVYVDGASVASNGTLSTSSLYDPGTSYGPNILNQAAAANRGMQGYCSNFRLVIGVAVYTGAFTPPTSPLAATQSSGTNISAITGTQTKILTFQSNRFIDNSVANSGAGWTLTVNGSLSVQAFSPFNPTASWSAATYGGSGYFDGSGDSVTAADNIVLDPESSDFTLEAFVYPTTFATENFIFSKQTNAGTADGYALKLTVTTGAVTFYASSGGGAWNIASGLGSGTSAVLNAWNHIAVVRSGSTFTVYLNAIQIGTTTSASAIQNTTAALSIGNTNGLGGPWTGYISNARLVKGTAVYSGSSTTTANFTVPTAPLTAITNTSFLLNFTNAGVIDATSKNDLETVGDAQISSTTAKWGSTSIKFDGTGDYLNTLTTWAISGSEAYTLEAWIYPTTVSGDLCIYDTRSSSGTGFVLFINSTGKLQVYDSTGLLQTASTTTLTANTWTYIALVRSAGSSINTYYVNGTSAGTFTLASFAAATNARIGARNDGVAAYNGYMQDFRITKGYARTITTPTAAFPTL